MDSMTATLLSADEYLATGDSRPRWTELIDGEVTVNNPTLRHQRIVQFINTWLFNWVYRRPERGEAPGSVDVLFDASNVLAPDGTWFAEGVLPTSDSAVALVVPQLVFEVRSPSTWRYDTTVKFRKYESAGVAEVWMVDTASNTVLVYRRSMPDSPTFDVALELAAGETLMTPLLDEFRLDVAELFDR